MVKRILMGGAIVSVACTPLGDLAAHSEDWPPEAEAAPLLGTEPGSDGEASREPGSTDSPAASADGVDGSGGPGIAEEVDEAIALQGAADDATSAGDTSSGEASSDDPADPGDPSDESGAEPGSTPAEPGPGEAETPVDSLPAPVRFVRLVADSEVSGLPYTSIAEFGLVGAEGSPLDDDGGWIASADSSELEWEGGARPPFAIDGDSTTLWHTPWSVPPVTSHPHFFEVDLGRPRVVTGFRYVPRQTLETDGRILDYRFFVSEDGVDWGEPVVSGQFPNVADEQVVVFGD